MKQIDNIINFELICLFAYLTIKQTNTQTYKNLQTFIYNKKYKTLNKGIKNE